MDHGHAVLGIHLENQFIIDGVRIRTTPFTLHHLRRVDHEIQQRLLDQSGIDIRRDRFGGKIDTQHDPGLLALRVVEITQLLHDQPHIVRLRIETDAAGELEEVGEDVTKPVDFPRQRIDSVRQSVLLALRHIEMHDVLAKQLSVEPHRRQRVLDLMRKTTGHRTELGESLGVPRLTFRFTRPVHHATQQHHHHGQHDRDGGADADTQPEQFHMDLLVCQGRCRE